MPSVAETGVLCVIVACSASPPCFVLKIVCYRFHHPDPQLFHHSWLLFPFCRNSPSSATDLAGRVTTITTLLRHDTWNVCSKVRWTSPHSVYCKTSNKQSLLTVRVLKVYNYMLQGVIILNDISTGASRLTFHKTLSYIHSQGCVRGSNGILTNGAIFLNEQLNCNVRIVVRGDEYG